MGLYFLVLGKSRKLEDLYPSSWFLWASGAATPSLVMDGGDHPSWPDADIHPRTGWAASWILPIFYHVRKFILRKHIPSEFTPWLAFWTKKKKNPWSWNFFSCLHPTQVQLVSIYFNVYFGIGAPRFPTTLGNVILWGGRDSGSYPAPTSFSVLYKQTFQEAAPSAERERERPGPFLLHQAKGWESNCLQPGTANV